ncbi:MAG: hypothetical protein NVSMB64_09730 [Candidatus Velthaea sp.]
MSLPNDHFRQIDRGAERNLLPVGRPRGTRSIEVAGGDALGRAACDVQHEQMLARPIEQSVQIALEGQPADVPRAGRLVVKDAREFGIVFRGRDDGNPRSIRRPGERADLGYTRPSGRASPPLVAIV